MSTFVIIFCRTAHEVCIINSPQKHKMMNEYLLLFRNAAAQDGYTTTNADRANDMPLWQAWIGNIALKGSLVSTAPIQFQASLVSATSTTEGPFITENQVVVSGFLICRAANITTVEEWSKSCPILRYPYSSVEIRPMIPFPTS
jgi:hypothetical protein